jgi:hypothetical protein
MSRDVTLQATFENLAGDESYELWLRHITEAWQLIHVDDVVVDGDSHQEITIADLVDGDQYTAQIRLTRAGRYRAGYLTADPDTWPGASRCVFTPGELVGVAAPTIVSGAWSRTSSSASHTSIVVTPADDTVDLVLYRDGSPVVTTNAPHVGDVTMVDPDPPSGDLHTYVAHHESGFLTGPGSNALDVFGGLTDLTGLVQTSPTTGGPAFYQYDVDWDDPSTSDVRVEDDYVHFGDFVLRDTIVPGATTIHVNTEKNSSHFSNGNVPADFDVRARKEEVLFAPTRDVGPWSIIRLTIAIADDETAHTGGIEPV